jgi:hypothetical protein
MTPDDTERDPLLQRHLVLLARDRRPSPEFADRVVLDLTRRGLVGRASFAPDARWLAAAALIFSLGIGIGAIVTDRRSQPASLPSATPATVDRIAVEVNVPSPGKSEVWF